MKKATKLLALLLAFMMMFTACGNGGSSGGQTGSQGGSERKTDPDSFTYGLNVEPAKLDPQANNYLAGMTIQKMIYDTLIIKDADGNFQPCLATEWEYLDDTTLRFKLRDDVTWHNGEKFTAEDVKYTIYRTTTVPNSMSMFNAFDAENTTVVDDYTIDVKFLFPFAPALNYLSTTRAQVVNQAYVEEIGEDRFAREPMGTGAFKFDSWKAGDRVTCVRNDEYWGNKPAYTTFIARFIIENATRTIELESGGVDAIGDVIAEDVARLNNTPGCVVITGEGFRFSNFAYDIESEPFNDIRVRKALAHAMDMTALVEATYKVSGVAADSLYGPTIFGYESQGVYTYDPELARSLLAEAGYEDGLEISITIPEEGVNRDVAEIAQSYWAEVGINCEIKEVDQATHGDLGASKDYNFSIYTIVPGSGDPDHGMSSLHPNAANKVFASASTDARVAELLAAGKAELDLTKRAEIYHELQRYCYENYIEIPIAFGIISFATRDYVEGFGFHAGNIPDLKDITFKS